MGIYSRRWRQNIGFLIGSILGLGVIIILSVSWGESFLMPGPSNIGHDNVQCEHCHQSADGSFRQQIQANTLFLLGMRPTSVDFGRKNVTNERCMACHIRPDDRHPVYRFFEPRYKEVRESFKPQYCISCHLEHSGKRVTLTDSGYCQSCHKKLILKHDPISIPHHELIQNEQWQTCLGCHDFHGNHIMETQKNVNKSIPEERILQYFKEGESPYSKLKHIKAKEEPIS